MNKKGVFWLVVLCTVGTVWMVSRPGFVNIQTASETHPSAEKCYFLQTGFPALPASSPVIAPHLQIPPEDALSADPSVRALAQGTLIQERLLPGTPAGFWQRERLISSSIQERLLHVRELWELDAFHQRWIHHQRDIYLADQVIVRTRPNVTRKTLEARLEANGMRLLESIAQELYTVELPGKDLDAMAEGLGLLAAMPDCVAFSEPDGVGFGAAMPNDPQFNIQWGHHNTGQSSGVVDADVDAPEFWDIMQTANGTVIAVLDSGLDFNHQDLQGVAWANPGEIPNDGMDNDSNGRVDDVYGWDFVNSDNDPFDDHYHGTHVTGIIAASRDNSIGVTGMISGVKILVCKLLNASNSGTTSNLIAATTYARQLGVPIMNLSLQSYPYNTTLNTEFDACNAAGILLSICAGNQGRDVDVQPNYPSCYPHGNIIAVGNHDRTDNRYSGSNYGLANVDIFAPGTSVYAPMPGNSYSTLTGTSMATPFVTAMATAIKSLNPAWRADQIKNSILSSAIPHSAYNQICTTGGRFNAVTAIAHAIRSNPWADADADGHSNLLEYCAGSRLDNAGSIPYISLAQEDGYLRMRMPHVNRPDVLLKLSRSGDLASWDNDEVTDFSTENVIEGGIPLNGSLGRFLRIDLSDSE
jgi:subtilisin family serine protease